MDRPDQDDEDFNNGISGVTGRPYDEPKIVTCMTAIPDLWWDLCGICDEWVELGSVEQAEEPWFIHAFGVRMSPNSCLAILTLSILLHLSVKKFCHPV